MKTILLCTTLIASFLLTGCFGDDTQAITPEQIPTKATQNQMGQIQSPNTPTSTPVKIEGKRSVIQFKGKDLEVITKADGTIYNAQTGKRVYIMKKTKFIDYKGELPQFK